MTSGRSELRAERLMLFCIGVRAAAFADFISGNGRDHETPRTHRSERFPSVVIGQAALGAVADHGVKCSLTGLDTGSFIRPADLHGLHLGFTAYATNERQWPLALPSAPQRARGF